VPVTAEEYTDIIKLTFDVINKGDVVEASLALEEALYALSGENEGIAVKEEDIEVDSDITIINLNADINEDGKVDISDLSVALDYYRAVPEDSNWNNAKKADVNLDGVVDLTDFTLIIQVIVKQK
jgi:hypothetical protein